jgi:hypothetical protein
LRKKIPGSLILTERLVGWGVIPLHKYDTISGSFFHNLLNHRLV